jgi:hypothetical protein
VLAELNLGRMLYWHGIPLRYVERTGRQGDDYDVVFQFQNGMSGCADAKCKVETRSPTLDFVALYRKYLEEKEAFTRQLEDYSADIQAVVDAIGQIASLPKDANIDDFVKALNGALVDAKTISELRGCSGQISFLTNRNNRKPSVEILHHEGLLRRSSFKGLVKEVKAPLNSRPLVACLGYGLPALRTVRIFSAFPPLYGPAEVDLAIGAPCDAMTNQSLMAAGKSN